MQTRTLFAALGIALSAAVAPSKAHAATTFTLNTAANGLSNFDLTEDGIALTVSNLISKTGLSKLDEDGTCIAGVNNDFCQGISSLFLTFDKPVRLPSYVTGYNGFPGSFIISITPNSSTSSQTSFPLTTLTPFNSQFTAAQGVPIVTSRTSTYTGNASLQLYQLTFEQVSNTVPGPVPLAGAAIALSWSRKLRHRVSSR